MNLRKVRILMFLLISIAVILGLLCFFLGKFPALNNDPTDGTSEPTNGSSVSTEPSGEPTSPVETFEPTTEATTEPTTEATTEPTTVPTTVPETTVTVNTDTGNKIADIAVKQLGKPYRYGGEGPDDFDTSGLVQYCLGQAGVSVPRSTSSQAGFGYEVSRDELCPGDVVFFWSSNPGSPEYAGIYVGNSVVVAALNSNKPVVEFNIESNYYKEHFVVARRFY